MDSLEQIKNLIAHTLPEARVDIIPNEVLPAQASLLVDSAHAPSVARFLRDAPELRLDYCSNATGVDWLEAELTEKIMELEAVVPQDRSAESRQAMLKKCSA